MNFQATGSFKPITAPYFPMIIKPRNFAKLQCKLQWLTPPNVRVCVWQRAVLSARHGGATRDGAGAGGIAVIAGMQPRRAPTVAPARMTPHDDYVSTCVLSPPIRTLAHTNT